MITREDLEKMVERDAEPNAYQWIQEANFGAMNQVAYVGHEAGYKAGASSLIPLLMKACEALQFECGNRCAHQNPCNAKEVLAEIESEVKKGME